MNQEQSIQLATQFAKALKDWGLTGGPFSNYLGNCLDDASAKDTVDALRRLEKNSYIRLKGPRTLDELGAIVEEKLPAYPSLGTQVDRHENTKILFSDSSDGFFETQINLTLRARLALATTGLSLTKDPAPVAEGTLENLQKKRQDEQNARDEKRPIDIYDSVISSIISNDPDNFERTKKYWDEDRLKTYTTHLKLAETDPTYKNAFDAFSAASKKFERALDKRSNMGTEGGLMSRLIENPFTRGALVILFTAAINPRTARAMAKNHEQMVNTYKKSLQTPRPDCKN